MTPEIFQAVETGGGCVDLSRRAKFLLTGADRVRYLNGQVTNDVRKASAKESLYACVTNAKGRIEGDVFIHQTPDGEGLLLDAEEGLRESLALRLEKYIVADDVTLTDVTEAWNLQHVFGLAVGEIDTAAEPPAGAHRVHAARWGVLGEDLWLPPSAASVWQGATLSADDLETLRILRAVPRWPNELNGEAFPPEAALENRAMDFAKGCYIGQETLSRIKMTGKMPRTLVQWTAPAAEFPNPTTEEPLSLYYKDADGTPHEAGVITSGVHHPQLDRWVGLGYVRQSLAPSHSVLLAGKGGPNIDVDVIYLKA